MLQFKVSPRCHVISFRVTDEELRALERVRRKRRTTLGGLVRDALSATDLLVSRDPEDAPLPSMCTG